MLSNFEIINVGIHKLLALCIGNQPGTMVWAGNSQKLVSKMKVVPDYFQKCNKFLAIPRLLYVSMELPGSGCTFKM